jgi:hypothetical protein
LTRELARFDVAYFLVEGMGDPPEFDPTAFAVDLSRWEPVGMLEPLNELIPGGEVLWFLHYTDNPSEFDSYLRYRAGRFAQWLDRRLYRREIRSRVMPLSHALLRESDD